MLKLTFNTPSSAVVSETSSDALDLRDRALTQYIGGFQLTLIAGKYFFSRIFWYGVGVPNQCLRPRKCGGQLSWPKNLEIFGRFPVFRL